MISQKYGKKVIFENEEYYLFPTPNELKDVSEEKIKFKTFQKADSVSLYKQYLEKGHAIS